MPNCPFQQHTQFSSRMTIILIALASAAYASLMEYLLHRHIMHKPVKGFEYPFDAHTRTHHHIFKADETYHLINPKDKKTIPMAWWNGPALIAIGAIPPFVLSIVFGDWRILIVATIICSAYYGTYEYIHWCMHLPLPRRRLIERRWLTGPLFKKLNGHHLLHHRYMGTNFNVVLPLWDLLTGTLILRAKSPFRQARGPCVPDVQPR